MKKLLSLFFVFVLLFGLFVCTSPVEAAKKSKKASGLSQEQLTQIKNQIEHLTKKVYSRALFSPLDNQLLIEIKLKLDNQILISQDPELSPLYFSAANLYKSREMKSEAIDCYKVILENFSNTAFAPKAVEQLKTMGITIKLPSEESIEAKNKAMN